jgi:ABC-type multidrug transport system ATPase subunit
MNKADKEHLATRLTLAGLGLSEVKDTYVGDTDVRGVSGGQRRRVTVGEVNISYLLA